MGETKFINAAVDVVVRNSDFQKNDPPYMCYDENWLHLGRCHNFAGIDCELIFEEAKEATHSRRGFPKQVYVKVNGSVEFDPEFPEDMRDPQFVLVPSRKGMESDPRQPIWMNGIAAYTRVTIKGFYYGFYELLEPFLRVPLLCMDSSEDASQPEIRELNIIFQRFSCFERSVLRHVLDFVRDCDNHIISFCSLGCFLRHFCYRHLTLLSFSHSEKKF